MLAETVLLLPTDHTHVLLGREVVLTVSRWPARRLKPELHSGRSLGDQGWEWDGGSNYSLDGDLTTK